MNGLDTASPMRARAWGGIEEFDVTHTLGSRKTTVFATDFMGILSSVHDSVDL